VAEVVLELDLDLAVITVDLVVEVVHTSTDLGDPRYTLAQAHLDKEIMVVLERTTHTVEAVVVVDLLEVHTTLVLE
jgi:hypothetical protein